MIAALLGIVAAGLGVAGGAPWWTLLAAVPFAIPGRIGPAVGALAVVALLPWGQGAAWKDALFLACGILAGLGVLHRIGHAVPWVALPWWVGGLLALEFLWSVAPPPGFWSGSDVAVRLRILVAAALAAIGLTVRYLPRYRNEGLPAPGATPGPGSLPTEGGGGTAGGLDETR